MRLRILAQALLVDRLEAEEHVFEAERLPELEHLLVAQQHVAARLEVVFLADAFPGDRLADGEAVLGLDEGDVVDDEDARLPDRRQLLDHALGADQPVAAAVERPGAAERAIPRTAARELDRGGRIEDADEILAPMTQQVARRAAARRGRGRSCGGGPSPSAVTAPGTLATARGRRSTASSSLTMPGFALALEHAIDRALAVLDDRARDERGAVAADADEDVAAARLGRLGEIDDLRERWRDSCRRRR